MVDWKHQMNQYYWNLIHFQFLQIEKMRFRWYLINSLFQPQFTYPHSVGYLVIYTFRVFFFSAFSSAAMTIELQCRSSREQFSKNINIKHKIVCVKNLRSNMELRSPFQCGSIFLDQVSLIPTSNNCSDEVISNLCVKWIKHAQRECCGQMDSFKKSTLISTFFSFSQ